MSQEAIRLSLDADVSECGDRFAGNVEWGSLEDAPRAVRVELRFWTEGRGDPDGAVVSRVELAGAPSGAGRFELPVPDKGPMSFDGALIRVMWAVEVVVDTALRSDPTESQPVTVLPRGGVALWARQQGVPPVIPPPTAPAG